MITIRSLINRTIRIVTLITSLVAINLAMQPVNVSMVFAQSLQTKWTHQQVLDRLGIQRPSAQNLTALSLQIAKQIQANGFPKSPTVPKSPDVGGLANDLSGKAAMSSAIMTNLDSSGDTNFRDVMLMADADGREDLVADHSARISNMASSTLPAGWFLTRNAMSEHTIANGFTESVYYYGDSVGNVYVTVDTTGDFTKNTTTVLNLPTLLNAFGTLNSADQIVITGLAVNPVADLSSFANVNGSFTFFNNKIGEILYVSFWDTNGGFRTTFNNQIIQSGVLAFPIADVVSPAPTPMDPGIQSPLNFPVTVGGAFGVTFTQFANLAGIAVDDDGSLYYQMVDLTNFTGANIVKIWSQDTPGAGGFQDRSLATSGFVNISTLNPVNGSYGTSSGPAKQVNRATNFSGTSTTFGNIVTLATGPNNVLYAGLSCSFNASDPADVQTTEGFFANPAALGPTPSMVISFADTTGASYNCTISPTSVVSLPIADGFADVEQKGLPVQPGVNNFRAFVLGNGPDVRGTLVGATPANTLQLDMQIDNSIFSGLAVDEENKVYVISGAAPVGIGTNPSPNRGEILVFPDQQPFDRRADFIDLRGDQVPAPYPPTYTSPSGPGDGKSDRFDHIYYTAPLDQMSLTPVGLTGLSRGFLMYLNRTRNEAIDIFPTLPNGQNQAVNTSSGPIFYESFDSSHQIAGGDDQTYPFRGDDSDGGGIPPLPGPLNGGFELIFRSFDVITQALQPTVWNAFYLNSNGNLTFGLGDTTGTPSVIGFSGAPRIAGAWTNLNTGSVAAGFHNTFPVQAMGFANINHFIVRWIDVPSVGFENCNSSNTFSISLYDKGTGVDANANQPLNPANPIGNNAVPFDGQEGPTDLRYYPTDATGNVLSGAHPRPDHSGNVCMTYGRMDLIGSSAIGDPVLTGVTPGGMPVTTAPAINVSAIARDNDTLFPDPLGIPMGSVLPASPYEFFTTGQPGSASTATIPAFDLRAEGNDTSIGTITGQPDLNRGQICFHNLDAQSIAFPALPDRIKSQMPITVSATASSSLPVTFTAVGDCTASGPKNSIISATGYGSCTVIAHQIGDTSNAPAPDVSRTFQIIYGSFLPIADH